MRLKSILLYLCVLASPISIMGATEVTFTPESLFKVIDERSATMRLTALMSDDAMQGVEVARSAYLPDINATWQVGYLGNGYLTDRDFSGGMGIHNPHFVNNIAIEAVQIIYAGGAINAGVEMAKLKSHLADLTVEENRQQMRFVLLSKLIGLQCMYKQREVIDNNIELATKVLEQMRSRIEQGILLENDYTYYELHISNLTLQRDAIDETIAVNNSAIATALDYPSGTHFSLEAQEINEDYAVPGIEEWNVQAASTNVALKKARVGLDLSTSRLNIENAERLPHIGAFAYGQFNSPITIEVPVLNKNFMYWGVGVNVSYSLSSLFKTDKKIRQAKLGVQESQQQIELASQSVNDQIVEAYQAFLTAKSTLRTQRCSYRLAEENYKVVSSRFNEGMALVTDLVDASNVRIEALTGIENAQSRLLFCLYRLKYITSTL